MSEAIVIIQTGFVGDTVLTTPLIDAVIQKHPHAQIYLLTTPVAKHFFDKDPRIAGCVTYDKHKGESLFDVVKKIRSLQCLTAYVVHKSFTSALIPFLAGIPSRIGFNRGLQRFLYTQRPGNNAPQYHEVERKLSLVCSHEQITRGTPYRLKLYVDEAATAPIDALREQRQGRPIAFIAPTSVWKTKQWSEEGFVDVGRFLVAQGYFVVITGAKGEEALCARVSQRIEHSVDWCGKTSLNELVYAFSQASLVVCNDSSVCHMATALSIPLVVVFCATHSSQGFTPYKHSKAVVVEDTTLACRPCGRHGGNTCPLNTFACIRNVTSDHVIRAVTTLLGDKNA